MKKALITILIIVCMTGCNCPTTPTPPDLSDLAGTWRMAGTITGTYERIWRQDIDNPWIVDLIEMELSDSPIWIIEPFAITILYGEPGMEEVPLISAGYTIDCDALNVAYTHTFEWTHEHDVLITESYEFMLSCDLSGGDLASALKFNGTVKYEITYEPETHSQNTGGMMDFEGTLTK